MIKTIGSQKREPIEETEYKIAKNMLCNLAEGEIILVNIDTCLLEIWAKNDCHAGYTIEIDSIGYEFVSTL